MSIDLVNGISHPLFTCSDVFFNITQYSDLMLLLTMFQLKCSIHNNQDEDNNSLKII